ncbi:hypothetical protein CFC35_38410 [Streptomyces sp. FBKL.4005]|nr:hypothetical protein CFC35_38410 [Streptomyces sp. FBKL.4005]
MGVFFDELPERCVQWVRQLHQASFCGTVLFGCFLSTRHECGDRALRILPVRLSYIIFVSE